MAAKGAEKVIKKVFGSEEYASVECLTLYIPNKDRNGAPVKNIEGWIKKAREVLTMIGGGATAMPPADGTWLNPESGEVIWEKTTIIFTFIDPDKFEAHAGDLRDYLHEFGLKTNQGEVVFEVDGEFRRIKNFDAKRKTGKG